MNFDTLPGRVDRLLNDAVDTRRLAGVTVMINHAGQTIHHAAAGWADREAGIRVRMDTQFRIASMTKPIVSLATLICDRAGILSIDDDIRDFLPDFAPRISTGSVPSITVRHLLTHTSGLDYGFLQASPGSYANAGVSDGLDSICFDMAENLARLESIPLGFLPGAAWRYSIATDVLGALLEAATGEELPAIIRRYVTVPLGMVDTGFVGDPARLAAPYADPAEVGGDLRRMTDPFGLQVPDAGIVKYSLSRALSINEYPSGGVGLSSTARDYMLFLEAIRTGSIPGLDKQSTALFTADAIPDLDIGPTDPGWGFGLGVAVLRDPIAAETPLKAGSWMWCGLYGTTFWVDPDSRLSIVALSNTAFEGMNGRFTRDLLSVVYR